MPEAVVSTITKETENHLPYIMDDLYDLSSGLSAYKFMLETTLETGGGFSKLSGGIGFILQCMIEKFDRTTDEIEKLNKQGHKEAATADLPFEEKFAKEIETIKKIMNSDKEKTIQDIDRK